MSPNSFRPGTRRLESDDAMGPSLPDLVLQGHASSFSSDTRTHRSMEHEGEMEDFPSPYDDVGGWREPSASVAAAAMAAAAAFNSTGGREVSGGGGEGADEAGARVASLGEVAVAADDELSGAFGGFGLESEDNAGGGA